MAELFEVRRDCLFRYEYPKPTEADALDLSIAKWQRIVEYYENGGEKLLFDGRGETCGLCHVYSDDSCRHCPVARQTGLSQCHDTPYEEYVSLFPFGAKADALNAARRELEFLQGLKDGN